MCSLALVQCECWHAHLLVCKCLLCLDVVIAGGLQPCFCLQILVLVHCEQVLAVSCGQLRA